MDPPERGGFWDRRHCFYAHHPFALCACTESRPARDVAQGGYGQIPLGKLVGNSPVAGLGALQRPAILLGCSLGTFLEGADRKDCSCTIAIHNCPCPDPPAQIPSVVSGAASNVAGHRADARPDRHPYFRLLEAQLNGESISKSAG